MRKRRRSRYEEGPQELLIKRMVLSAVGNLQDATYEADRLARILGYPTARAEALAFLRSDWCHQLLHFLRPQADTAAVVQSILKHAGLSGTDVQLTDKPARVLEILG